MLNSLSSELWHVKEHVCWLGSLEALHLKFLLSTSLEGTLNMTNTQILDSQRKISFSACYRFQLPHRLQGLGCHLVVLSGGGGTSRWRGSWKLCHWRTRCDSLSSVYLFYHPSICFLATMTDEQIYFEPCPLQWCSASPQIQQQQMQPTVTESPETMSRNYFFFWNCLSWIICPVMQSLLTHYVNHIG